MSLMLTPVTPEVEGILRLLSSGPFAPPTEMLPEWMKLAQRGYIRRNGVGRQGRVLFSITGMGERMLARCPSQR
jgi:DNA-binding PadR family transcriptional regulator